MAGTTKTSAPAQGTGKRVISVKSMRSEAMLDAVDNLRERGELCDFEIRAGSEVFPVHRFVLQISSEYFRAMLGADMIEAAQGYVEMRNIDEKAVMSCVRFIYTGEIEVELDTIHDLLNASHLMQLEEVKSVVFEYCIGEMTADNCLDILALSKQFMYEKASKEVIKYISSNISMFALTSAFTKMEKEDVDSVMLCDTASSNAASLWRAVTRWINDDEGARSRYTPSFLALINESDLGCLFDQLITCSYVLSSDECRTFLTRSVVLAARNLKYLKTRLNTDNCLLIKGIMDRYCDANDFDMEGFNEVIFSFVAANIESMYDCPYFLHYAMDDLLCLLRSKQVSLLTPEIRWTVIVRWSSDQRRPIHGFSTLFKEVDLLKLPISLIEREVWPNYDVRLSSACKDMIIQAICIRAKRNESKVGKTFHPYVSVKRLKK